MLFRSALSGRGGGGTAEGPTEEITPVSTDRRLLVRQLHYGSGSLLDHHDALVKTATLNEKTNGSKG